MEAIRVNEEYMVKYREVRLPNGIFQGYAVSLVDDKNNIYITDITSKKTFLSYVDSTKDIIDQIKEWGTHMIKYIDFCDNCHKKSFIYNEHDKKKICSKCKIEQRK